MEKVIANSNVTSIYVTQKRAWDYLENMRGVWWHEPTERFIQRPDFQMGLWQFLDKTNSLQVSRTPRETSKRHWTNKGQQKGRNSTQGREVSWLSQAVYRPSSKMLWQKCFFCFLPAWGSGLKVKRSHPERKTRISLIGYQSITLYTGAMLQTLLWQKLKVSIMLDIRWLSGILLVQQRCCTRKVLYGEDQWTLLEVTTAWCLQDHTEEIGCLLN